MNLGERLKDIRDDRDLSIKDVAYKSRISENKIYNFEINSNQPNIFQLDKLATCYNLPLKEIVNKTEVNHEITIRFWINLLVIMPLLCTFMLNRYDNFLASIIIMVVCVSLSAYITHLGAMNEIIKKLAWQNPITLFIQKYIHRGIAYTISFLMLFAGIALFFTVDFGWGILLGLAGFFAVLGTAMRWDANK
ncbi:helix-turn-helix domain-containing protein [Apilactobacillus apisilvae]|uniref:Helix-turn-helix domain-containing protein n=1 Tax=Apilactobacillus apisilvae TaxID=2923364 RepID=A0ABY4PGU5_9LACO|nr:helix-turn-helix transcriptional regulator [Apilactobacillus apisilvae]UQS84582.1 helix-turn-helix domain-containing protein [Apilactobacillus apisilvae]